MQQKELLLDWRFLEDLAATHEHHHNHLSISTQSAFWHCQQQFSHGLHCSRAHSCCRLHAAYSSFIRSYLPRRIAKLPVKFTTQSSHLSCSPLTPSFTSFPSCTPRTSRTPRTSCSTVAPDLLALQRPTKLRARNRGCRVISVRLRPSRLSWPSMPSMQRTSPPTDRPALDIRAIVSNVVPPHAAISSVQLLPHHRLQQVYEVKLSDMATLLVVLPPLPILRLLRSELDMTKSEALVVRWLRDELREAQTAKSLDLSASDSPCPYESHSHAEPVASRRTIQATRQTRKARSGSAGLSMTLKTGLLQCLPCPLSLYPQPQVAGPSDASVLASSTSSSSSSLSSISSPSQSSLSFNVFQPPLGTPIAALSSPLTAAERMSIDYQAGKLLRCLSRVTSKSGNFGPALSVLAPQSSLGMPQVGDLAIGMSSWSVAFHSILESILRDGEDVAVALAYPTIRKHFRRLGHLLDSVTTPSLVVVDAMDDTNLLVQRSPVIQHSSSTPLGPAVGTDSDTTTSKRSKQRRASPASPMAPEQSFGGNLQSESSHQSRGLRSSSSPPFAEPSADIVVTGLRDWSHCIFGDPLFASVFCDHPSTPFLGGFNSTDSDGDLAIYDSFINQDEGENRAVRVLLYQCYHAVVQIVRGFYRPGRDQTTQELAARKRLTEILAKLEAVDDDPKRRFRHRRPSGEMSPAKKP